MKVLTLYIADSIKENLSVRRVLRENKIRRAKFYKIRALPKERDIQRTKNFIYFNHSHDDMAKVFADSGANVIYAGTDAPKKASKVVEDIKVATKEEKPVEAKKTAKNTKAKKVK